jgi:hypothetical protein
MDTMPVGLKPARARWSPPATGPWLIWFLLGVYVLLAIGLFWPTVPWSTTTLPAASYGRGFGDPAQMTWFLEWVPYAMSHGMNIFHTNYLDYPLGVDLANGTSVPLLGVLASPITFTLGPVAAFNILLRVAFASSAGSMFLVLRNWSRTSIAFAGGLVFGFGPYMITQGQNHLNLVFVALLPVIVWCLYELLFEQRRRPIRMGLLLGALCGAQALINPELLAMLALVVFAGLVVLAVAAPHLVATRVAGLAQAALPAVIVFVLITGYLLWGMLLAPGHLVGSVYPSAALQSYRSDVLEPIIPTVNQFIAPLSFAVTAYRFVAGNFTENAGYLSLPFVLLFAYFSLRWRKDRILIFSAALALISFVLSLGSRLTLVSRPSHIPLPEALLVHLPLWSSIVPARFACLVALFAVIAVALGAEHFFSQLDGHRTSGLGVRIGDMSVVAAILCSAALLFPLLPMQTQSLPWAKDIPATLRAIPSGTVVLSYPLSLSPWTETMSWQAADEMRFRIIGGYVTQQQGKHFGESYPVLLDPKVLEETMIKAQLGSNVVSGEQLTFPKPDAHLDVQAALCTFLQRYHVGAVTFWKSPYSGVNPKKIRRIFYAALGRPTLTNANATILIWLTKGTHCTP